MITALRKTIKSFCKSIQLKLAKILILFWDAAYFAGQILGILRALKSICQLQPTKVNSVAKDYKVMQPKLPKTELQNRRP